jgi:hypothetical protein
MKIGNKEITLRGYAAISYIWYIIPTISVSKDIFYLNRIETNYTIVFQFIKLYYLFEIKIQKTYDTQDF